MPTDERREWFLKHIGIILYRNDNGCHCAICEDTLHNGVMVGDEMHAIYLYDTETEYTGEGHPLRYFDTKEEVQEFIKSLI